MRDGFSFVGTALVAATLLATFNGCSKGNAPPEVPARFEKQVQSPPPAKISGPIPASIGAAYQAAEQVFGVVSSADWTSGPTLTAALKHSLVQVRADLNPVTSADDTRARVVKSDEDQIASDMDLLEIAIRAHDRESARRESNRITMPLADLAGIYDLPVPGELMMLKYLSRRFDIGEHPDDASSLKDTADMVRQTWAGLRPAVEARGGLAEAQRFDELVAGLETSGPPGQIGSLLRIRIDEVEGILNR